MLRSNFSLRCFFLGSQSNSTQDRLLFVALAQFSWKVYQRKPVPPPSSIFLDNYLHMPNFLPLRGDSIYMPSYIYMPNLLKKSPLRGDFRSIYMNFVAYTLKISPLRGDIIYMPSYIYAEFFFKNSPLRGEIIYMPNYIYARSPLYR